MKVNKRIPLHWLWLSLFSLSTLLSLFVRCFVKSPREVVLYGHKLNGNLKAIYEESENHDGLVPYYLSMDYRYCKELKEGGVRVVWGGSLAAVKLLSRSKIIVSDHGLHCLVLLLKLSSVKFIDVWHGIPFKGFDKKDFKVQRQYDEVWVTSPYLAKMYEEKFGFRRDVIKVVGYARTDKLVRRCDKGVDALRAQLGLRSDDTPVVLFAPTWVQDDNGRSIYPFNCGEGEFYKFLNSIGQEFNCVFLMRRHLNSTEVMSGEYKCIKEAAANKHADTEMLLLISDILIYDWSSIAFDFLLLSRPAIYLDVAPPFKKGFSFDASYRFGAKAGDFPELKEKLYEAIFNSSLMFEGEKRARIKIKRNVYGQYADGCASKRACGRLEKILGVV